MNPKTLHKLSYGLYVICSKNKDKINGQIANVLFQITSQPPIVGISINKQNLTHEYIEQSKVFTASILAETTPMPFIGNFGFKTGRDINKFEKIEYKLGETKAPVVIENSIAYIEANVIDKIDCETHTVFIGKISEAEVLADGNPMTYEYYHKCKGGVSPKTAPTYDISLDKKEEKEEEKMDKYVCNVCGYVYDPEKGDPDNGIEPGTSYEDLPEDWVCPLCGASKDNFSKQE